MKQKFACAWQADSDFDCDSEQDDEATIAAQEREAGDDSAAVQQEIDQLRADQEVPIEELRRQYAGAAALSDDDGDGDSDDRNNAATPITARAAKHSGSSGGDGASETASVARKEGAGVAAKDSWNEEKDTGEVDKVHAR